MIMKIMMIIVTCLQQVSWQQTLDRLWFLSKSGFVPSFESCPGKPRIFIIRKQLFRLCPRKSKTLSISAVFQVQRPLTIIYLIIIIIIIFLKIKIVTTSTFPMPLEIFFNSSSFLLIFSSSSWFTPLFRRTDKCHSPFVRAIKDHKS